MMYSLHGHRLYIGFEDIINFEDALAAEEDRKRGLRLPNNPHPIEGLFYRERAKYTQQVQRYLDIFGRENIHIIIFDDFKSDTARVYRETLRFLGVNEDFQPDFKVINSSKRVHSKTLRNFLRSSTARLLGRGLMPYLLRQKFFKGLRRLNTKYEPRPPMDPELRRRLQLEFLPEVEQLSKLLGRDLTHWCRP